MTKLSTSPTFVAIVIASYWVVSISLVFTNKLLVSNPETSIPAPFFVTWFQCIFTCVIIYVAGEIGEYKRKGDPPLSVNDGNKKKTFFHQFPKQSYQSMTAKNILPLSVIFVGMITFNNICLKYVEVSFYNVARSLTICFNVVFTFAILGKSTSKKTMMCLGIVIFGFVIGIDGEMNFSMIGTIFGVFSSIFVSLNSIYTKKVLKHVNDDHWRLTFINNANAILLFIPLILYFEIDILTEHWDKMYTSIFWMFMCIAGFFGFLIGIIVVLQIRLTSPLTHNISGTAKAAVQSILAFYIWGNQPTFNGVLGIFLVLFGSSLYTYVRMNENKK